jgi:hypothetical protein
MIINWAKVRQTRESVKHQMVPSEDDYKSSEIDAPGIPITILAWLASWVVTVVRIFALLPYYTDSRTETYKEAAKTRYHWYLPHTILMMLFIDARLGFLLTIAIPVAKFWQDKAVFVDKYLDLGIWEWTEANLPASSSSTGTSDVPQIADDKYWMPASERVERSGDAPYKARLDKDLSVLAVGETRSGKTSSIKMMAAQLDYGRDTSIVAHGSVGEYRDYFGDEIGVGVTTIGKDGGDRRWNLFKEIDPDAGKHEAEQKLQQIAATMIPISDGGNDYFDRGAREVFVALCLTLWAEKTDPHHGDIHGLLREDPSTISDLLADHGHGGAADKVDTDDGDCWPTLTGQLKPMFVGDFAREGSFSFREYIKYPDGSAVVIESPEVIRSTGAMFSAMIDEALVSMLETPDHPTYAILDEVDTLQPLNVLSDMAARGLAQRSRLIVGIQTVSQLRDVYGRDATQGIVGNMPQIVGLSPGTGDCIEMLQEALGRRRETVTSRSRNINIGESVGSSHGYSEQERERYPISESEMNNWDSGEGIVVGRTDWWHIRLGHPDEYIPLLREHRGSVSSARSRSAPDRGPSIDDLDTVSEGEAATAGGDDDAWSDLGDGRR